MWLVIIGIASVQLGAGIAKNVFDDAAPMTLVWLRLATSAVILTIIARPSLRGRTPEDWQVAIAFGVVLGTMNWAIYESFAGRAVRNLDYFEMWAAFRFAVVMVAIDEVMRVNGIAMEASPSGLALGALETTRARCGAGG